jgi:serine phosphatase RsbU (regulator of sigma subunit)/anti-sigma regulatory factor (Ser/Thr protein kinase)
MAASEEAGLTKSEAYKLRLAVDEIVTNIMVHGYAESGKTGTVEMQAEVKDGMLRLAVEDTGPAFDPFSLAPPDDLEKPLEERAIGGLGVFLAIENVDELKYERVGDRNRNIFIVKIPAPEPPPAPVEPEAPPAVEKGPRVLVVDDDKVSRQATAKMLDGFNYDVITAEDSESLSKMLNEKPEAVILSMKQTRENPYQHLKILRGDAQPTDAAVIVLSTPERVEGTTRALELGADDFLLEPIHPALLHARVRAAIDAQDMRQKLQQDTLDQQRAAHALLLTEKIERDVQIARQIQLSFLPNRLPEQPGWELAGRFRPARQVAGDWYDAFALDQVRRLGLVIADVCDKGVGPAMFMALMRSLIRAFAQQPSAMRWFDALDPDALPVPEGVGRRRSAPTAGSTALKSAMEQTNNYIAKNHGDTGMFATLFFGVLDPATGLLQYVNGGHEPPMIIGPDGVKDRLKPTGMAVGIMENSEYSIESVQLQPGEIFLAYTDGVTDARNPDHEFFSEERLLALANQPASTANGLADRLMDSLQAHIADADQFDDITILAARRAPA